jgi:replicative DNA helicase
MEHVSDNIGELKKQFVNQPMGVTTGFTGLDQAIWGLQPKTLMTVGGRPGMGKTGLLADVALSASAQAPVGVFSLEMPFNRLQARLCANIADLNYRNIRAGVCTEEEQDKFLEAAQQLKKKEIYIDDSPGLIGIDSYWLKQRKLAIDKTIDFKIRNLVRDNGCKVIIVDYLQLITHTNASIKDRRIIVGNITEQLRDYAKELNFACILLCQLRRFDQARMTGKSKNPVPTMDDLKESGEIENHSDVVLLLHRPDYFLTQRELNLTEDIVEENAELMICKNRDGPTGSVKVNWHSFSMSYRDKVRRQKQF